MLWKKHLEPILLGGTLILAAVLRIFHLGIRDLWYDEAFTANLIRNDWMFMFKDIAYDVHPPLHYILLKSYALIGGTGIVSLRSFSVICGVLSVWLVYLIGKELFHKRAGLYAGLFAATSPFAIQYSQEVRMYALYGLLILIATYCFVRAIQTKNAYGWYIAWGISFALACLTHYMAFLFGACFLVAWIIARVDVKRLWTGSIRERLAVVKGLFPSKGMLVGGFVALLIFLPWLPTFFRQLNASQDISNFKTPAKFVDLLTNVQIFLIGTPKGEMSPWSMNPNVLSGISTVTLSILIIIALTLIFARLLQRSPRKTLLLLSFFAGILFLSYALYFFDKYYFISRYVFPAAYLLFLLLGYWLSTLVPRHTLVAISIYGLMLLMIQPVPNSQGYNALSARLPQYKDARFYSLNTFDYMIAKYYLGADRLTLYNVGWPQYDSRPWPGIGYGTKRTENFEDLKNDPQGIVIWNTLLPLERRDDRNFDTRDFEQIAKYKNIELYRSKRVK